MVLAVVMALVPRHVRVTSVALYNFIITNISGLSTTLVPLLRARFRSPHVFHFLAEPLAGAAAAAAGAGAGAAAVSSARAIGASSPAVSWSTSIGALDGAIATGAEGGEGEMVEFSVSDQGSRGLRVALLFMYPGMYLASSGEKRCLHFL